MTTNWVEYFRREQQLRTCAERAGLEKQRARELAEQLAAHPLPRKQAARLLARLAIRALEAEPERRQQTLSVLGAFLEQNEDRRG